MNYKFGDVATCKMCGAPIRYIGPHWEHFGELQPRHPAWSEEKDFMYEVSQILGHFGVAHDEADSEITMKQVVSKAITILSWYVSTKYETDRLCAIVQANQDFFGDPPAGESCIKLAADKLEGIISEHRLSHPHQP